MEWVVTIEGLDGLGEAQRVQIAEHVVRGRPTLYGPLTEIDEELDGLKWKLRHGQVDRAHSALDRIVSEKDCLARNGDLSAARLHSPGQQLLTYIRSNRTAIANSGARYGTGRRIATSLAESAVNSLDAKQMAKAQQMRWTLRGTQLGLQARAAMINGNLRQRFPKQPELATSRVPAILHPTPPLLAVA